MPTRKTTAEVHTQLQIHEAQCAERWKTIYRKTDDLQASWRPATAWVCVAGFAVNFLISPLLAPFGIDVPQADTSTMLPVLMGMLGLGGMRSYEKTKGLTK